MADIRRVGVVGCGAMGAGIAALCAVAGLDVRVVVSTERTLGARRQRVLNLLGKLARKGQYDAGACDSARERVALTADIDDLADRDLVIESVTEDEYTKSQIFGSLDKVLGDSGAILATNTSSLAVTKLARATGRPERVVGMHFFNPVPTLPLVELVGTMLTSPEVVARSERFLTGALGKQVIRVPDRAGFVVNALLIPYLLSAVRMFEARVASAEEIDRAMTLGCAHPIGPLALSDLIGLDVLADTARALQREYNDAAFTTPPVLARMVEAGVLGKKSGRGFHTYAEQT